MIDNQYSQEERLKTLTQLTQIKSKEIYVETLDTKIKNIVCIGQKALDEKDNITYDKCKTDYLELTKHHKYLTGRDYIYIKK